MNPKFNRFYLPDFGVPRDFRVNVLLLTLKDFDYLVSFVDNWSGNDLGNKWKRIMCSSFGGNILVINFRDMDLIGTIPLNFSSISSLKILKVENERFGLKRFV